MSIFLSIITPKTALLGIFLSWKDTSEMEHHVPDRGQIR